MPAPALQGPRACAAAVQPREEITVPRTSLVRAAHAAVLPWAFLLSSALVAAAQGTPDPDSVPRITLEEALRRMEQGSLELRLAQGEVEAARARAVTASTRPNPTASVDREQLGGEEGYHETVLAVGQTLDLAGQRGARREAAARDVAAAEARLAAERFRLGAEVRRVYLRAAILEARLGTVEETGGVFRSVERAGTSRLREGDISDYELRRIQTEAARYEMLLADTRLELAQAGRDLARLAGVDSAGRTGEVRLPADTLGAGLSAAAGVPLETALARMRTRPDVRAAQAEVEAAAALVEARRRGRRPNPTLSAGLKEQAGGLRGAVVGVSLPLPLSDRNQGPIAEAEAARAQAETRLALALRDAESETRGAWERRRLLAERLSLRSGFQTRAAALLRSARVAYEEGEMTLVELLDAADAYRTARDAATTLLADYLQSVADLERATGGFDP
jgi:cobalt-zinc-cadmium efflux system outer membrane protein